MSNQEYFNFKNYDAIGFDLDNALVRYKVYDCISMEFQCLADFLVKRGYSKEFLNKPLNENADFLQKGLILDFDKGNLMRTCPDGSIQTCCHGTKKLNEKEIEEIYAGRRWEVTDVYCKDMLVAWNGTLSEKIRTCLDIFDLPAALAFARIIDSIDLDKGGRQEKYDVWPDILCGLMNMYSRENFSNDISLYFKEMRNDPGKYVYKNSENVANWLQSLKREKKVFLVTGSHIDFASLTASIALGPNWRDFFDAIVCFAKKPGFFTEKRPFRKISGIQEKEQVTWKEMKSGEIYSQGNFSELQKFLSLNADSKIVYIGDNLIQDCFTPSHHVNIDTVAIVEEMLVEGENFDKRYEILHSSIWGNYFHSNGESTLWENIIRKHSKLCVASIEDLAKNATDFNYKVGYYPTNPK